MSRPPKLSKRELEFQRQADSLKTQLVCLRSELAGKQGHVNRLEFLLCERSRRIDELNGKIDALRNQNRRLDAEAERLAEMVRLPPSSIAS